MVKPAISRGPRISDDALADLLAQYGFAAGDDVQDVRSLPGGFSGTNYRVTFAGPRRQAGAAAHADAEHAAICLKICHGYNAAFVESQARVQAHLQRHLPSAARVACYALPVVAGGPAAGGTPRRRFATTDPESGDPVLALTFLLGRAADAVLEAGVVDWPIIFEGFGQALARIHSVPVPASARLRRYVDGGACDVQKHVDDVLSRKMAASAHVASHPFVTEFYPPRLAALKAGMAAAADLPQGIIHGDPFLDNALVSPADGSFVGFVDFEDATTGPLLFDAACCIIGTCFAEGSDNFDMGRFRVLMSSYTAERPLTTGECRLLVPFLRLTLLCNCTWRFINFNVDHREVVECRDRYRELQDRIVSLEQEATVAAIQAAFSSEGVVARENAAATRPRRVMALSMALSGAAVALAAWRG